MGQLTTGIKDFFGAAVESGIILDQGRDAVAANGQYIDDITKAVVGEDHETQTLGTKQFTHRGENCHHLILADLASDGDKLEIYYSLDGKYWFFVTSEAEENDTDATGLFVAHNTSIMAGNNGCPPRFVMLRTDDNANITRLHVRTYGSTTR